MFGLKLDIYTQSPAPDFEKAEKGYRLRHKWLCVLTHESGRMETFDFYTGDGLREKAGFPDGKGRYGGPVPRYFSRPEYNDSATVFPSGTTLHMVEGYFRSRPTAPELRDLLGCLVLDATALDQDFESWASDFGYDTDSRKAEAVYFACQSNGRKLRQLVGPETFDAMRAHDWSE